MSLGRYISLLRRDMEVLGIGFAFATIRSKLTKSVFELALPDGKMRVRGGDSDVATIRQVFRDNEYSLGSGHAANRLKHFYDEIRKSGKTPVIVDAGANIGAASRWFKWQFPDAVVVAIEPDSGNAAILKQNAQYVSGILVQEAAIGSEPGFVSLKQEDMSWGIQTERAETGCPIVTVSQAASLVENGELFLVKVDIEGFESDLFKGSLEWIDRAKAVFLEPHDWMLPGQGTSRTFQAAFGQRDFEIYLRGENILYLKRDPN